jgi:hypothetical protein
MNLGSRPAPDEHGEFHIGYIAEVPDGDIRETLAETSRTMREFYGAIPEARGSYAYAPGKWTVREVVGHVADSERVFSYRALRFGRGDATPLPSYDQEIYVPNSNVARRPWSELLDDLFTVRAATLNLSRSFEAADWARRGEASGVVVTVRALAWILVGHELHHRRILRERYGL